MNDPDTGGVGRLWSRSRKQDAALVAATTQAIAERAVMLEALLSKALEAMEDHELWDTARSIRADLGEESTRAREKPEVVEWIYADALRRSLRRAEREADEIVRRGYGHTIPADTYTRIAELTGTLADSLQIVTHPVPSEEGEQ